VFCASLIGLEIDKENPVIEEQFDKQSVDLRTLKPPRSPSGKKQQYIDGQLHFICKNNHLILAQEKHVRSLHLERYINKILSKPSSDGSIRYVTLETVIPAGKERLLKDAKKLHLKGLIDTGPRQDEVFKTNATPIKSEQRFGTLIDFIKGLVNDEEIDLSGITKPRRIEAALMLNLPRKAGRSDKAFIEDIMRAFRHCNDEIDYEFKGRDGETLKPKSIQLTKTVSVSYENGMPINGDLFSKMTKWFNQLVENEELSL
jgi:hypothetical protein